MRSGLEIIETRAEGLSRFMQAYARLAKLPQPNLAPADIASLIRRAAALETRLAIAVNGGPDLTVNVDAAQIEQVLINLFKNAVDAALETRGGVRVSWRRQGTAFEVRIEDDGPGLANTANLFVPFFTTKPSGSGIGLLLCRQICREPRRLAQPEKPRRRRLRLRRHPAAAGVAASPEPTDTGGARCP